MEKRYLFSELVKLCKNILILPDVVSSLAESARLLERDHGSFHYCWETWELLLLLPVPVPLAL